MVSLASKERTYVIESLYQNRKSAIHNVTRLLQNTHLLKIFCGADNDSIRVKKDWNCFPVNVLDLQDLFVLWKLYNYSDCYQHCYQAIKEKLMLNNQEVNEEFQINEFLRNYTKPSLEFLINVFLDTRMKKNELCTLADYRKRPLHQDLINYSGQDSRCAVLIFELMAPKVGEQTRLLNYVLRNNEHI